MKNIPYTVGYTPYLTKDKSPVSEGEEHHMKNEDEIDESHGHKITVEILIWCLFINYTK